MAPFGAACFVFLFAMQEYQNQDIQTCIFVFFFFECETWSLLPWQESRVRVFETRVQRRIFGRRRDEVTREWRIQHNEELNDLYCTPNIIRVIKSRTRWAGNVARMGSGEVHTWFWWGNLRERYHLGDPGVDGRIVLRWIFKKWDVGVWTGLIWLRPGTDGGHL